MIKDKIQNCKKCQKTYIFSSTGCDLCAGCIKKCPYFLSFIEEFFIGSTSGTFGRVEVYANNGANEYAIDELRFIFKGNKLRSNKFHKFREAWDFQNVTKEELGKVKKTIKDNFYDNG